LTEVIYLRVGKSSAIQFTRFG